jgi:hypothetical protein
VNLDGYPLDITIQSRITDVDGDHEPFDRPIIEWFSDSVVVEVATGQTGHKETVEVTYWVPTYSLIKALNLSKVG